MKELYKLVLSYDMYIDNDNDSINNVPYLRIIQNHIYHHRYVSIFGIPLRKSRNYQVIDSHLSSYGHNLKCLIDHGYYDDFKIMVEYVIKNRYSCLLHDIMTYTKYSHYRFGIYLLKRLQSPLLGSKILDDYLYRVFSGDPGPRWYYKIFKYISTNSCYSEICFDFDHRDTIQKIFHNACSNNQYKLVKILLSLKTKRGDKINVNMSDIIKADRHKYKDLVVVLYDAWLQNIEHEKTIAKNIRDKYL